MTDAMKSVGQDMDQEAADELVGVERHKLIASVALGPVILPFERDALAGEGDEPAVGNSSAVCVAGKVGANSKNELYVELRGWIRTNGPGLMARCSCDHQFA